jgi:hypothetical protein
LDQQKEDVMKGLRIILSTWAVTLGAVTNAFAGTAKVYSSSILALAFVGFCALVVVVQLIPAIITLYGMLKGLASKREDNPIAKVESGN